MQVLPLKYTVYKYFYKWCHALKQTIHLSHRGTLVEEWCSMVWFMVFILPLSTEPVANFLYSWTSVNTRIGSRILLAYSELCHSTVISQLIRIRVSLMLKLMHLQFIDFILNVQLTFVKNHWRQTINVMILVVILLLRLIESVLNVNIFLHSLWIGIYKNNHTA